MQRLKSLFLEKKTWLENWVVLLSGLWIFLLPFSRSAQIPAVLLAGIGLFLLIRTKGRCAQTPAAKGFLLLIALYLIPVALSMLDAPSLKYPMRVFLIGIGSGLAGIALITVGAKRDAMERIVLIFAAVVGFWFVYAGAQALTGKDLFREAWWGLGGRISGPFTNKNVMGYFSGPYSALLLMFALHKKWKPALLGILFIFTSIIVVLNNSRGGWIMYAVVATGFIWQAFIAPRKHKLLLCAGASVLGLAMIAGLYFTSITFQERIDQTLMACSGNKKSLNEALTDRLPVWEAAWDVIADHPINGCGARNFRKVAMQYWNTKEYGAPGKIGNTFHPHQLVLEYAVGTGIIGVTGLFLSMGLCLAWWFRAGPQQKTLAGGTGLTLLASYFPLNTHRALFASLEALSIWVLIALYCAAVLPAKKDAGQPRRSI